MAQNKQPWRFTAIVDESLMKQIDSRGDRARVVRESLDRYFYLLSVGMERIRRGEGGFKFTGADLGFLADLLNGTRIEPFVWNVLPTEAADAEDELYTQWGVDRDEMEDKLSSLDPLEEAALIDAVERYWRACATGIPVAPSQILG